MPFPVSKKNFWGLIFALLVLCSQVYARQSSENGVLDLRFYDIENQNYTLGGNWLFYWQSFKTGQEASLWDDEKAVSASFPKLWTEMGFPSYGYGTYIVKIILHENHPGLAVYIPDFYSSYRLYANGEIIAENGKVGKTKETYTPFWFDKAANIPIVANDTLVLALQIANFHHSKGGARQPILLGKEGNIREIRLREMSYALVLSGALLMGGLFFSGPLFFRKTRSRHLLLLYVLYRL